MSLTVADLMSKLPEAFMPEKAADLNAVIQLRFGGPEGGEWYVTIQNSQCQTAQGVHPNPDLTLSAEANDIVRIFTGELDGMQAFMQGRLRLSGNMGLAMKLLTVFRRVD